MVEKNHRFPVRHGSDWWPGHLDPFRHAAARGPALLAPEADASGTGAYYEINIELPGVDEGDIEITLNERTLVVKGEKKPAGVSEEHQSFFDERHYGGFERSFRLPEDIDAEHVEAELKNGVLGLRVQRIPEETKQRKIKIKGA